MIKQTLTLCTLTSLSFFAQAQNSHLQDALLHIEQGPPATNISLLKHAQEILHEKWQNNRNMIKWGTGQTLGGLCTMLSALYIDQNWTEISNHWCVIAAELATFSFIYGLKQLGTGLYNTHNDNKSYEEEITVINQAIENLEQQQL